MTDISLFQNPSFVIEDIGSESFARTFNNMTTCNVIIELKSVQDSTYSEPFKVNLAKMNYIGDDLSNIAPFDFPLIVFRFTPSGKYKKVFFTTKELCSTLSMRQMIRFTPA